MARRRQLVAAVLHPPDVTQTRRRPTTLAVWVGLLAAAAGCASAAPPAAPVGPPPLQEKLGWILRLEDQRVLRDPDAPPREEIPAAAETSFAAEPPTAPPPVALRPVPDLVDLLEDDAPRVRRRAALAIGRVGRSEGIAPLAAALHDPEPEVRQMAAFALGLIGNQEAAEPLLLALRDPTPLVQGRAAEALGRLGVDGARDAIRELVSRYIIETYAIDPEDLSYPHTAEVEAFRLGLYALADLRAFEQLAAALLQPNGQPVIWWWPVAEVLSRIDDARAFPALSTLVGVQGSVGVSLAARGLGALGDPAAVEPLIELLDPERRDRRVLLAALRALAQFRDPAATEALRQFVVRRDIDPMLRYETVAALAGRPDPVAVQVFVELLSDPWPLMRAAALRGLAEADAEMFLLVLSGIDPDPDWRVRIALADGLVHAGPEVGGPYLIGMLDDADRRVVPAALSALVGLGAPEAGTVLLEHLDDDDVVVRKTAATLLGVVKPPNAIDALAAAYAAATDDPEYLARAAIVDAAGAIGGPAGREILTAALDDRDWAVRIRAAQRLEKLVPGTDHGARIRPAPAGGTDYGARELVDPSVSPHVYIDTARGTIQIELAVLDAPLTAANFMRLARRGYYDGLTFHRAVSNYVVQGGDPRSDSEGGPGYTIRDEINQLPFLRGTVGMALDWEDTGGSQFFITRLPQPRLDGRYTVFGRVVDGMDVVDQIQPGDAMLRVRVWDGVQPLAP